MRLRSLFALVSTVALALYGCGSGQTTTSLPTTTPTTNITVAVTPSTAQLIDAGQTLGLSATVTNDQGGKGVSWTVTPGGGSLAGTTGLTNTYTAPMFEALNVQVTATSIADPRKSASVTVNVTAAPAFSSTAPLPMGYRGIGYSSTLPAAGGAGAKTFSVASGTLPPGLTLSATGVLSGTPTTLGTYTLTARVVDSAAAPLSATATFTLNIATLTINPIQLSGAVAGMTYPTATLTATAAIGNVTYSLAGGALPTGLVLSPTGVISGTPTTAGTSTFTVGAVDTAGQSTTLALSIAVASRLTFADVTLPAANAGSPIAIYQFTPAGGTVPYRYAVAPGSSLPAGLSLTNSGVLSGTPTTAGDYTFRITATDGGTTLGDARPPQQSVTATVTLHVSSLTLAGGTLPVATANTAYSTTLQASNGTAPYTYAVTAGALPTGLALGTNGVLSGTPTTAGTSSFSVTVTDAGGNKATASYTLQVQTPIGFTTAGTLPAGVVGTVYSTTLQANGGTAPYTYALTGGALPTGLSLSSSGVLSGTPTAAGTYTFTVTATDSTGRTGSATFTLTVTAPLASSTPATLPGATVNAAYTTTLQTTGGTAPYTYALTGGALPTGLTLSNAGVIGGTPTTVGTYSLTVTVTDAAGRTLTTTYSLTVSPALAFTTATSLPDGTVGTAYSTTLQATGGTSPYTYTLTTGSSLPAGLSLSSAGVLSGTPTAAGNFSFSVTVTDAAGKTTTATFTLTVNPNFYISNTSLPNIVPYSPYSTAIRVVGGTAPYTYSITAGALPNNIVLNATTGKIEGTTNSPVGTYTVTVKAVDANNQITTKTLSVAVSNTLSPGTNNALLTGSYAFTFTGFLNGSTAGSVYGTSSVGVFTFDGNGGLTGSYDVNSSLAGYLASNTISGGTYRLNTDQRGTLIFTSNGVLTTITINASKIANGVATQVKLLEFDNNNPSDPTLFIGGGTATLQTFTATALTGRYVFALRGETSASAAGSGQFGAESVSGAATFDPAGTFLAGSADLLTYQHSVQATNLAGTYAATDATLGRGTLSITGMMAGTMNFVYYYVSPTEIYLLSTDPHSTSTNGLLSGTATLQSATTVYTAAALNGTVIGYVSGSEGGDGNTVYQDATFADVYRLAFNGAGAVTLTGYTNRNGTTTALTSSTGTYAVGLDGRVTFPTATTPALSPLYLTDANTGIGADLSTTTKGNGILRLEPQTATAPTDGRFGFASQQTTTPSYGFVGTSLMTASSLSAVESVNFVLFDEPADNRLYTQTDPFTTSYTVDSTTGLIQVGPTNNSYTGFVINGGKFVTVQVDPGVAYETGVVFER